METANSTPKLLIGKLLDDSGPSLGKPPDWLEKTALFFILPIAVISFAENLVVLYTYSHPIRIHKQRAFLVLNMTACDIILTGFAMPMYVYLVVTSEKEYIGLVTCAFLVTVTYIASDVFICVLFFYVIECYRAVYFDVINAAQSDISTKYTKWGVLSAWFLAVFVNLVLLNVELEFEDFCYMNLPISIHGHRFFVVIVLLFIIFIVITFGLPVIRSEDYTCVFPHRKVLQETFRCSTKAKNAVDTEVRCDLETINELSTVEDEGTNEAEEVTEDNILKENTSRLMSRYQRGSAEEALRLLFPEKLLGILPVHEEKKEDSFVTLLGSAEGRDRIDGIPEELRRHSSEDLKKLPVLKDQSITQLSKSDTQEPAAATDSNRSGNPSLSRYEGKSHSAYKYRKHRRGSVQFRPEKLGNQITLSSRPSQDSCLNTDRRSSCSSIFLDPEPGSLKDKSNRFKNASSHPRRLPNVFTRKKRMVKFSAKSINIFNNLLLVVGIVMATLCPLFIYSIHSRLYNRVIVFLFAEPVHAGLHILAWSRPGFLALIHLLWIQT